MFRARLFSSSLRSSTRLTLYAATRPSRSALTRRMMSSQSHAGHGGSAPSDTPWMIGSALVFGPLFLYLVSPTARKGSHGHHEHKKHRDEHGDKHASQQDVISASDDEGTEVSGQEVKESVDKAFEVNSPKDAQQQEETVVKVETPVEESSTTEAQSPVESPADAITAPESERNRAPSAPVEVGEVTNAASDEKAQNTL